MDGPDSIDRRRLLAGTLAVPAMTVAPLAVMAQVAAPARGQAIAASVAAFTAAPARVQVRAAPRPATAVLAFEGQVPGPVIRIGQDAPASLSLTNRLDQPLSLHVQGVRPAAAADGVAGLPAPPLPPGETRILPLTSRDAGTFLYRPMVQGLAAAQMERGLYGVLIVTEKNPPVTDREILVIFDDWRLDAESQIQVPEILNQGAVPAVGNVLTINGAPRAQAETVAPAARVRLRLVNAMTARIMPLQFEGATTVIAIDGQPTATAFQPKNGAVTLTPGGRVDLMVDMPPTPGQTYRIRTALSAEVSVPVLELTTDGAALRTTPLPPVAALPANPLPERLDLARAQRAACVIDGGPAANGTARPWLLNGTALTDLSKARPLFRAQPGTTIVLSFQNQTVIPQPMTVHGHHGRLLFVFDDGWDPFWTDTVLVQPGRTARFAFIADNPGTWLIRSAYAGLFDAGVATVFTVG